MASVKISINNKSYAIDCGEGQEQRIIDLARYIDDKLKEIKAGSGPMAEDQLFVITSLILADEIHELMEKPADAGSDNVAQDMSGFIPEEKVSAIIEEVSSRLAGLTKEVRAL